MKDQLELLGRHPLVTYAMAAAMAVASLVMLSTGTGEGSATHEKLERARTFYEQNAEVTVSARNRQLLGPEFVDVVARAYEEQKDLGAGPIFSSRLRQRTQNRFEQYADEAFESRMAEFAAWRHGVSGPGTPIPNHASHVLIHGSVLALAVSVVFFVIAGIGLETAWGSLVFAGFCLLGTLVPSVAFRLVDAEGGIPMAGASGLVATLLGAYFVRGFGGRFALPGWVLLPVWLFAEFFFVRDIWIDNYATAPIVTHAAALATGVVGALIIQLLGVESKLVERTAKGDGSERNPAIARAEHAMAAGDHATVWKTLSAAHQESPKDEEVSLAFWNAACEYGRVDEAVGAIVPVMRDRIRRGNTQEATGYWRVLLAGDCVVELEAALCIKLGEALLDEGHPDLAIATLARAMDRPEPLPTALAQRIVRVARDLDPALTHRAATRALEDPQLDPQTRESLERLEGEVRSAVPSTPEPAAVAPTTTEQTRFPGDAPVPAPPAAPAPAADLSAGADELAAALDEPSPTDDGGVDPNALSLASLERELAGDLGLDAGEELTDPDQWNDPHLVQDLSAELGGEEPALFDGSGLSDSHLDNAHIDAGALDASALSQETSAASGSDTAPLGVLGEDPGPLGGASAAHSALGQATATGDDEAPEGTPALPPIGASTSSSKGNSETAPLAVDPLAALADAPSEADPAPGSTPTAPDLAAVHPEPQPAAVTPPAPAASAPAGPTAAAPPAEPPAPALAAPEPEPAAGSLFGSEPLEIDDPDEKQLRELKLVVGVPIGAKEEGLEVEIEGRGSSRVPFERIEAVAVAAVAGLSEKPVLVIDLVLNWLADPGAPLKVVRFHSNRFDPKRLAPSATTAVDALSRLVAGILKRSGAAPLPNAAAAAGAPFARYASTADYEREVLGAGEPDA